VNAYDIHDTDAMIDRIRNAKFRTTRLSTGYDEEQVDAFLDRAIEALRSGYSPNVRGARFSTTRLRPGYVQEDVESLLKEIATFTEGDDGSFS
jgi:DivIVA domain-containing protein